MDVKVAQYLELAGDFSHFVDENFLSPRKGGLTRERIRSILRYYELRHVTGPGRGKNLIFKFYAVRVSSSFYHVYTCQFSVCLSSISPARIFLATPLCKLAPCVFFFIATFARDECNVRSVPRKVPRCGVIFNLPPRQSDTHNSTYVPVTKKQKKN